MAATLTLGVDDVRFLEWHETQVHATHPRVFRDLGDAYLLTDPRDPDPFWNRLAGVRWPANAAAFDRRVAETMTLFGILDRRPHVWPPPLHRQPADLVDRLLAAGFMDVGEGLIYAHRDPSSLRVPAMRELGPGVSLAIHSCPDEPRIAAEDAVPVLMAAFGGSLGLETMLIDELTAGLVDPRLTLVIAYVDGKAAAVAKATTFDRATYLSSIGTLPVARGHGLGALVTRAAAAAGRDSRWVYLGVYVDNHDARRLYERLGFAQVGEAVPDLLLP